jgi:hypothetical protein
MHQTYKNLIKTKLFDNKGRLCGPKTTHKYLNMHQEFNFLIEMSTNTRKSICNIIYDILNDVDVVSIPNCEFCHRKVNFVGFFLGYKKTCGETICLRLSYGKNPHIPTAKERIKHSQRMKEKNPMFNEDSRKRAQQTTMDRYGLMPYHKEENKLKQLCSRYDKYNNFSPNSRCYKSKEYMLPSGNIVLLQGYEPQAMDILLKTYKEDDIIICGRRYMFYYTWNKSTKRYFPDLYISSEKRYIEVKSVYTYNLNLKLNEAKRQAVLDKGFAYNFFVIDSKENLSII